MERRHLALSEETQTSEKRTLVSEGWYLRRSDEGPAHMKFSFQKRGCQPIVATISKETQ